MSDKPARYVGPRLALMMFLQFFVWGSWYSTVSNYLLARDLGDDIAWAFTVGPIAAILAPFFLGMVADRFFATERVLAVMHFLGGIALVAAPAVIGLWDGEGWSSPIIVFLFLHMLFYMPTLGLINTLAFHNLTNREKQFPMIRVFGTIGWIVAGLVVSWWLKADRAETPFYVAGGAGALLGLYSLTLPHTPPPAKGKAVSARDILGLEALTLLRRPAFFIFIVSSFLVTIPLAAYFPFTPIFASDAGFKDPAAWMTIGQMWEVLFMIVMPFFFVRLGVKWMLVVGILAWVIRYGLFAGAAVSGTWWMIIVGISLHGICYDFFFVTGQIYVDRVAPVRLRGQAQGFLILVTLGLGLLIGAQVSGALVKHYKSENFGELDAQAIALRTEHDTLLEQAVAADDVTATSLEGAAQQKWEASIPLRLQTHNWRMIWSIPAIGAAILMLLFILIFREEEEPLPSGKSPEGEP